MVHTHISSNKIRENIQLISLPLVKQTPPKATKHEYIYIYIHLRWSEAEISTWNKYLGWWETEISTSIHSPSITMWKEQPFGLEPNAKCYIASHNHTYLVVLIVFHKYREFSASFTIVALFFYVAILCQSPLLLSLCSSRFDAGQFCSSRIDSIYLSFCIEH